MDDAPHVQPSADTPQSANHRISAVPRGQIDAALELLFGDTPPETRTDQIRRLLDLLNRSPEQAAGLLGAWSQQQLLAVCFVQIMPGRVAGLLPPKLREIALSQFGRPSADELAQQLIAAACALADSHRCTMVQSLLETDAGSTAEWLRGTGFHHAADLLYLVSLWGVFPTSRPASALEFIPVDDPASRRLAEIVERTYQGTRDCPALNGARSTVDVLAGYRQVGSSRPEQGRPEQSLAEQWRPELWRIVRRGNVDLGCLLIADHVIDQCWELVYMGVVPEARGQGYGIEIARFAQWLAGEAGVERLVLAADAENAPALDLYSGAGFTAWDRRSVFLKITNHAEA